MPTSPTDSADTDWIQPQGESDPLIWGRRDGIVFGLPSPGGLPGPRGLIRVGVISPTTCKPALVNFIATEPVVVGTGERWDRMAFSELEMSELDPNIQGKRMWIDCSIKEKKFRGQIEYLAEGARNFQRLSIRIEIERFSVNGAHVYIIASIDSDRPDELRLQMYPHYDSAEIEQGTVTATMGNYERLRYLFLKDQTICSGELYENYAGSEFIEHCNYPLEEILRTQLENSAIAVCCADEASPSSAENSSSPFWKYPLPRLTQYWRVPESDIEPDLTVRVNGRATYWQTHDLLPGGVAYENFELRQAYKQSQVFIFGITSDEPWDMKPAIPHLLCPADCSKD